MARHYTYHQNLKRGLWSSVLLILFSVAASLGAQTTQGSAGVNGTVKDPTGAVIQSAKVVLTQTSRHLVRTTMTNSAGVYLFPQVSPGVYSLQVIKSGYEIYVLQDVRLEVGQLATLDASLKIGSENVSVTVSANQQLLLDHDSNALGTVIDSAQVEKLPLNGRNYLDLVRLSGGSAVLGSGGVPDGAVGAQVGHGSRSVALAGNMAYMTGYLIDGIAARGGRLGESAVNVSVVALDQFKVQQSFFMPDQGPNAALISATTKGGNNAFHGQLFEFLRNDALDAHNYFSPTVKDDLKRNQFGGGVGGPIIRNKIWFYGFYEGTRQVDTTTSNGYTPTQDMFNGDFSALSTTIYDPLTYNPATGKRSAFQDNKIPSDRINQVSKNLLKYYLPGSSLTSKPSNITGHPRNTLNDDQFGIRIDAALSPRQTLYGQYIHDNSPAVSAGLMPLTGALFQEKADMFVLDHTFTISSRLINTARIGFLRDLVDDSNVAVNGGDLMDKIGISNTPDNRGLPSISINGYNPNFGSGSGDLGDVDDSYQAEDSVYFAHGNHTFQFGANLRYYRTVQENANAQALGIITFQALYTAQSTPSSGPVAKTGDAFADFLLGYPATGTAAGLPKIPYRYTQVMPYFSDLWKMTPQLTLNYGLGWFLGTVPDPRGAQHDWPHSFDPTTGLLTYAALGQIDPKVIPFDAHSLAPRIGFAWSPNAVPHTVFRTGFGIYYTDVALPNLQYAISAPPYGGSNTFTAIQTNPVPQTQFGVNVFQVMNLPTFDSSYAENLPPGTAPHWMDPDAPNPAVKQWNFSIEHSIGNSDVAEIDYLGSAGQGLQLYYDSDACIPTPDLRCDYSTRPYPRYASLDTASARGISSYEAVIAKYTHRGHGLDFHIEYTEGKALGNGMQVFHDTTKIQNAHCLRCNYARTSFDINHALVLSTVYALPFGRGRQFGSSMNLPLDEVLGGWTVTAIGSFTTGTPVTLSSTNTTNTIGTSTNLPNRTCNGNDRHLLGTLRSNGYIAFNTSCFSVPTNGYYGTSRQNVITGPGNDDWDIGIEKSFPLLRETHLEFRGEMFNAFNHAQFSNPGGAVQNTANFGKVTSAKSPRIGQLSLKLIF